MSIARIIDPARSVAGALHAWNAARADSRVLGRLPRRELADLGYVEGDVDVAALLRR